MTYIFGVTLPSNKKVVYALSKVFGLGHISSADICSQIGVTQHCKVAQLNDFQISKICKIIEGNYIFENELKKEIMLNIKRLSDIGAYRGYRHSYGLPVRGQRTHTNAQTQKKISAKYKNIKNKAN